MRPANDSVPKPWGPLAGFWSWQYLNLWKTIKLVTSKRVKSFYEKFPDVLPPGNAFPNFELKDIHGNTHRMADYLGKKCVVITTGAIT